MATLPCQLCSQPSEYCCSCQNPAICCCLACSYVHHETSGTHNWTTLQQAEKKIIFCQMCSKYAAEFVCCCGFPLTFLCVQCRSEHIQKERVAMHLEQPIEKAEIITSLSDIEKARRVLENKSRIEKYLNLNKAAASKLKDEINTLAEQLIARINFAKEETLKELSEIEEEIDEKRRKLKQEVELHLFAAEVRCSDELVTEAFDTSKQFICAEMLSGELLREGKTELHLVRLHIPPWLKGSKGQLLQVERDIAQEGGKVQISHSLPIKQAGRVAENSHLELTKEMIDALHAPCREDFSTNTPEMPATIGRHRLPTEPLHGEYWAKGSIVEQIQLLGKYSSWRRSRGDGNSFYRCVGALLCEHYCRPSTPVQEFGEICELMFHQQPPFSLSGRRKETPYVKLWLWLLRHLYLTKANQENTLQQLQYYLQISRCDLAIITAVREYTATYCRLHANDSDSSISLIEDPDSLIQEILENGREAREIALKFTARVFSVILHILTADSQSGGIFETTYGPSVRGWYPAMYLLRSFGQYSVLIPKLWDAADGYDFTSNSYSPVDTGSIVDYEEYVPA